MDLTLVLHPVLFLIGVFGDFAWAKWSQHCTAKNPYFAANWSFLIYVFGLAYTMSIVESQWTLVICYLVGSYAGTVLAVKSNKDEVDE